MNPNNYSPTLVDCRQEDYSLLKTNNQKMENVPDDVQSVTETRSNNCIRVQTGSRVVFVLSRSTWTENAAESQEVILVKSNNLSPNVPGGVHSFTPQLGRSRSAAPVRPSQPMSMRAPEFRTPHSIVGNTTMTRVRRQETKLDANKEDNQIKKSKGYPKPGGSIPTEMDDSIISSRLDIEKQLIEQDFVKKKKKKDLNEQEQCSLSEDEQNHDFTQKSEKKKNRNQHLNRQVEVNDGIFEFGRDKIELQFCKGKDNE